MSRETDVRGMFDRDYIGSWDLEGRDVTLTIASVKGETLTAPGAKKSKRPVVKFEGKDKGMIFNKTNANIVAKMYGPLTDRWVGKRITIYPTTTKFGSETVECIRVRASVPEDKRPAREPGED